MEKEGEEEQEDGEKEGQEEKGEGKEMAMKKWKLEERGDFTPYVMREGVFRESRGERISERNKS